MGSGQYSISFDTTGFPLIRRRNWSFAISLFPVSKFQFEQFLAKNTVGSFTDSWYRNLLKANQRAPWQAVHQKPWHLFLTGLSREEINLFLNHLGPDFRLPTKNEWLTLHYVKEEIRDMKQEILQYIMHSDNAALPVAHWIQADCYPLTQQGILEHILDDHRQHSLAPRPVDGTPCIGRPFPDWIGNAWNPVTVRPITDPEALKTFVGFRPVLPWNKKSQSRKR